MQPGDVNLSTVVQKDDHPGSGWVYGSMIRCRNDVFVAVACSNRERLKGDSMQ